MATIATAVAAVVAGMRGVFRRQGNAQGNAHEYLRLQRDKDATENSARTLESVSWLVDQLQEEITRKGADIDRCAALVETLKERIIELERELRSLKRRAP